LFVLQCDFIYFQAPFRTTALQLEIKELAKTDKQKLTINSYLFYLVGLDVERTYTPYYLGPRRMIATSNGSRNDAAVKESKYFDKKK